jgi:hypothetical protein
MSVITLNMEHIKQISVLQYRRHLEERLFALAKYAEELEQLENTRPVYVEFLRSIHEIFSQGTSVNILKYDDLKNDATRLVNDLFDTQRLYLISQMQTLESML